MFTNKDIIRKLTGYRSMIAVRKQLEYELEHYADVISEDEVISSLALSSPDGENISTGRISDRTSAAALEYADELDRMRLRHRAELEAELRIVTVEISRMDFYIGLLEPDIRHSIISTYVNGDSVEASAREINVSTKTVSTRRKIGIQRLTEMYNRLYSE